MKRPSAPRRLSVDESFRRLRVFGQVPPGFEPLKATKRQLTAYGLPHPPNPKTHPRQAALWRSHMADRPEFVVPDLRIDDSLQPAGGFREGTGIKGVPPSADPFFTFDKRMFSQPGEINEDLLWIRNLSPQTSNNWSGAYAPQPPGEPFNNVFATFNVPTAQPPPSAWNGKGWDDGRYQALTWVGLDGYNGPDVMQAGVLSRVDVSKGILTPTYYAFVEFWPALWSQVQNFDVSPGDMLSVTVCAPFTTTHAVAAFTNKTTGQATTVGFDAPGTTVLTGVVAEWIVENPDTSPPGIFANYGNVTFYDCIAGSKTQERDLRSATPIKMVIGGSVVSTGWLQTRSQLQCTYGP